MIKAINKKLSIGKLSLDPKNPRLSANNLDERAIIQDLVKKEDVFFVADSIAHHGYFPNEALYVVKQKGKNIVVEGNRRLCALKVLNHPSLSPKLERRIQKLPSVSHDIFEKVPVLIVSKDDANRIRLIRHTQAPVKPWGRANQAAFYRELLEEGETINDISKKYGISESDIEKFLRTEQLYELAKRMPLNEDMINIVRDNKKFSVTMLDRVVDNQNTLDFLGIKFTQNDVKLKGTIHKDEFMKGYKKIIQDIANKNVNSRTLNTSDDIQEYLGKFSATEKPNRRRRGRFSINSFLATPVPKRGTPPAPRRKQTKHRPLIPADVKYHLRNSSLEHLFKELQKSIVVSSTPHATVITFRSFLEMSLYQFLFEKYQNSIKKYIKFDGRKSKLKIMMEHVKKPENMQRLGLTRAAIDAANTVISANGDNNLINFMNCATHNPHIRFSEDKAREIWDNCEALVKELLQGPGKGDAD